MISDKEKILLLLEHLNISKHEFSREAYIPSATIKANLRSIATRYPEISPGWLLMGEGEMLKRPRQDENALEKRVSALERAMNDILEKLKVSPAIPPDRN